MKEEICRAFCNEVSVRDVPAGLAISTPLRRADGDAIGFYVIPSKEITGLSHLEDDGGTIPYLEAAGVDFETQTRSHALETILAEHEAEFDADEAVIRMRDLPPSELPRAALRFVALLLRLSDFLLLTQERIESTFKDDASKRIRDVIGNRAQIVEDEPVSQSLSEVKPDMLIRAKDRKPVAVFLAQSAQRINNAIFLQMAALYEAGEDVSVVALLELESSISRDLRQRAANRLSTVPVFRGDEVAAIQRIEREALGMGARIH